MKHIFGLLFAAALAFGPRAEAQEKLGLEIGYMPILPVSQLFVTIEEGWMGQAGIEPELVQFQNGPAMVQALLAGQLDVAYFGIGPAMVARARGADIRVVASNIVEQISMVTLGQLAPYFDGDHKTAFERFRADRGRKAVITTFPTGSVPETVLQYWLRRQLGMTAEEIEENIQILYQGAAQVQQALLTGAVDGAAILEPIVSTVTGKVAEAKVVAAGSELFPNQPGAVLAIREGVIASHRGIVTALVKAHVRATGMLKTDPGRATPHVAKYVGGGRLDPVVVRAAIVRSAEGFVADPNRITEGTRVMHDFQAEIGTLKQPVNLDALFDLTIFNDLPK